MQGSILEFAHAVNALPPVADAFAATVLGDVVNINRHKSLLAILYKGVGATGTSTITVQSCDNAAGDNPVAVPFRYRSITTGDTHGALTAAAAAGFATTAGSNHMYLIEVDAVDCGKENNAWVYINAVEVVDSPVLGGILYLMVEPRHQDDQATVIA